MSGKLVGSITLSFASSLGNHLLSFLYCTSKTPPPPSPPRGVQVKAEGWGDQSRLSRKYTFPRYYTRSTLNYKKSLAHQVWVSNQFSSI